MRIALDSFADRNAAARLPASRPMPGGINAQVTSAGYGADICAARSAIKFTGNNQAATAVGGSSIASRHLRGPLLGGLSYGDSPMTRVATYPHRSKLSDSIPRGAGSGIALAGAAWFDSAMSDLGQDSKHGMSEFCAAANSGELAAFLKAAHQALDEEGWSALIARAGDAHESGRIDLVAALSSMSEGRLGYGTQRFIEQIMPKLLIELTQLVGLIKTLSARGQSDGITHFLLNGFGTWCEVDTERPITTVNAVRAGEAPAQLLHVALLAGMRIDRKRILPLTIDIVTSGSPEEQEVATHVLGRFDGFTSRELDRVVASLEGALALATGAFVGPPLRALLTIASRAPVNDPVGVRALASVAPRADAPIRGAVAIELMFDIAKVSETLAAAALALLRDVEASETATIDAIDQIVSQNLEGRLTGQAHDLLDRLLARRAATMKLLDSTAHVLMTGNPDVRSATIVRWLSSDRLAQYVAVRDLCSGFGEDAPRFELNFNGLPSVKAERIARRCCAVLMVFPETIASVLASLLRTGPPQAIPVIETLLFDPLLINYWTGPRIYLESILPGAPLPMANAIRRAFDRHDRYIAGVEAVRALPELRPSQHRRFLVETKRREERNAISRAAQGQSVFAEIFPTSLLLYGDSAIFDVHVEQGTSVREETQLQSHEFSHELPRVEIIDPFGSWYQREHLLRGEAEE